MMTTKIKSKANDERIVKDFIGLTKRIPSYVQQQKIVKTELSKITRISRATLHRKLKSCRFDAEETLRILKVIHG